MTECNQSSFEFATHFQRQVVASFDGGTISSESGSLLLREVEQRTEIVRRFAACFRDYRDPEKIEHTVEELIAQRVYGITLGYEDLNDHEQLRQDPVLAVLCGKKDVEGLQRRREQDRGKPGAGKSTLNRLELTPADANEEARYKKIVMDEAAVDRLLVDLYIQSQPRPPQEVVLDLDVTDDPIHGNQEGRFFHAYYGDYCYLPLYIFIGDQLLCARLRSSNMDGAAGAVEEVARIVEQLRGAWPAVDVIVRADSGFCREPLMSWCEQHRVDYVLGLAKNRRLRKQLRAAMKQARQQYRQSGHAARVFTEFNYCTRKSWSRGRRVIGKAEYMEKGENPRFVVTSLPATYLEARSLYEDFYCARGEMENRIKEQQLGLFADRTSTAKMRSNQLRLYFSSIAYCLLEALRRLGLKDSEMAEAQCSTIRLRLLKIGAQIRVSVRRICISMAAGHPGAAVFEHAWRNLQAIPLPATA
jgi:Transposase DDE domain group 1